MWKLLGRVIVVQESVPFVNLVVNTSALIICCIPGRVFLYIQVIHRSLIIHLHNGYRLHINLFVTLGIVYFIFVILPLENLSLLLTVFSILSKLGILALSECLGRAL